MTDFSHWNNFFGMLHAVENYYGAGSDQWHIMAGSMSADPVTKARILKQCPGVNIVTTKRGGLYSYSLVTDAEAIAGAEASAIETAAVINSNTVAAGARTALMEVPGNAKVVGNTVEIASGATKVGAAGTGTATLECVLGHAATWLLGAGIGMKLGVWIDGALYNANPEFWDSHNLSTMNPELWKNHWATNWILEQSGYPVSAVLADKDGQFYCDEELFALYAKYLYEQEFFNENYQKMTKGDLPDSDYKVPTFVNAHQAVSFGAGDIDYHYPEVGDLHFALTSGSAVWAAMAADQTTPGGSQYCIVVAASREPFSYNNRNASLRTFKDGSEYYFLLISNSSGGSKPITGIPLNYYAGLTNLGSQAFTDFTEHDVPFTMLAGTLVESHQPEGVHTYDQMPVFDPSMDVDDILNALKQQMPQLFEDRSRVGTLNDDGTVTDRYYIPFNIPSGGPEGQPETRPTDAPKLNPTDDPDADPDTDPQIKTAKKTVEPPSDPTQPAVPNTGEGSTPPYVPPTGTADALYSIYNPTVAQVQALGAWLWSSNFIDQLLKMFNNPMDAIISLHKIYGTPHTGGTQNIKVGYLDSGVSSKIVDEQYIHIDCGTVNLYERFANVFDYAPYTEVNLYLPFVGIVPVDVADVMRGRVNVIYHIDVITGAVLVEVKILRDGDAGGVIYQYTGSCAEHYPLSSGSYMGIVTGAAGIAGGIAATIATGGAAAPMLLGAAAGIGGMHANIQRSSSFTANAGAMGIKKPYFIISRPQTAMAQNYGHYVGRGANTLALLSNLSGYVKVKEIYLVNGNTGMTDAEQEKIKSILKEGVVI